LDEITQASHKLAEQIYKASAQSQNQGAGTGQQNSQAGADQQPKEEKKPGGEEVVDAEYKEDNK